MKYRIAMWASAGFLVAGFWALYFFPASPIPITLTQQIVWVLSRLTCPVALASSYFHFGVSVYWALLANAATYGLIGLIRETLQHQLHHAK
jgi:hypothetical protein